MNYTPATCAKCGHQITLLQILDDGKHQDRQNRPVHKACCICTEPRNEKGDQRPMPTRTRP